MDTLGTPLPVELEIEPFAGGRVLYERIAPPFAGGAPRAMIYFTVKATNNTDQPLAVEELTVSFPGLDPLPFPSRDVVIPAHGTKEVGLRPGDNDKKIYCEQIELDSFPTKITVTLAVPDLSGGSVSRMWDLGPHEKSYDFFSRPEKGDFGEFIQLQAIHFYGGGSQHFGHDVNVLGWNHNDGTLSTFKTDGADNADTFLWERPLYAMADGIVVRAVSQHPDNPSPSVRAFFATNVGTEYETKVQVTDVAATALSKFRMVLAVVTDAGHLRLTVLEQDAHGKAQTELGSVDGPAGQRVVVTRLDDFRVIAAVQSGHQCELTLWKVSTDGLTITQTSAVTLPDVAEVRLVKVAPGPVPFVVTAARTTLGALSLAAWPIVKTGFYEPKPHATATAGVVGAFDVMALDAAGRFVTAVRTESGRMKVIAWELEFEGGQGGGGSEGDLPTVPNCTIARRGEKQTWGTVEEVSLAATGVADRIATAVRTKEGTAKLIVWQVDADANIVRRESTEEPGAASLVHLSFFKTSSLLAAYRTGSGTLRVITWEVHEDDNFVMTIEQDYSHERGATDLIAMARVPTDQPTVVTAVRTAAGTAKVILWQFTDSNLISILHGDELVHFVHLHQGSVPERFLGPDGTDGPVPPYPAVTKGELIGRMGHSGKSGGPHTHIHVQDVRPDLVKDLDLLVAKLPAGEDVGPFRPLQFHGVLAMRQDNVKPGWMNNPMSELKGEGTYFEQYVVWPWNGEYPGSDDIETEIAALEREIAKLVSEIASLQGSPTATRATGPDADGALLAEAKELRSQQDAYETELAALRAQAARLGCRVTHP